MMYCESEGLSQSDLYQTYVIFSPLMEWYKERESLKIAKSLLNKNSQLKRKMMLVKRLRNLNGENIKTLVEELRDENMERFYTEIITSLLFSKPSSLEEVKNIVRILSIYVRDMNFSSFLFTEINKNILGSLKNISIYWYIIVYVEVKMILDSQFNYVFFIEEAYKKSIKEIKILILEYIHLLHNNLKLQLFYQAEKNNLKDYSFNIIENLNERSSDGKVTNQEKAVIIERLCLACRNIDLVVIENKSNNGYKQLIVPNENEFDYYVNKSENPEQYEGLLNQKDVLDFVKKNSQNISAIDGLCRTLRRSENVRLIPYVYNKLKNNVCFVSILARILRNCGNVARKLVVKMIEDVYEPKNYTRTEMINNICIISELIKFKYIISSDVFGILDHLFKGKDIELYCMLLKNIGRFYLCDEHTNCKTRVYLDKVINYGNRCNSIECVYINDMIFKIFPHKYDNKIELFHEFIYFYLQDEVFSQDGITWKTLVKNRKFLFSLFIIPWEFEDINFMSVCIENANLSDCMIDFILFAVLLISDKSKMKTLTYIKLLGKLLKLKRMSYQDIIIQKVINIKINMDIKTRILIYLLEELCYHIKIRYVAFLKEEAFKINSSEINTLLFNLCEKIGERYESRNSEDSLDEEIRLMDTI